MSRFVPRDRTPPRGFGPRMIRQQGCCMDTHRPQSCPPPQSSGSSTRMGTAANGDDPIQNPTDAFRDISQRIAELKAYAAYYLAAKMDGIKLSVRNVAIYAALGVVGLIAG